MKYEIDSLEEASEFIINMIDKNSQDWKKAFMIKNNNIDDLKRYKFLVAAILENIKDDIKTNLKDFRFAHDENERNMQKLLGRK